LHDRVRVQAELEEAGQIHSQFSGTGAASHLSRGTAAPGFFRGARP